jgi:signal transduction histidine kinase
MNAGSGASDVPSISRARAYLIALAVTVVAVTATIPLHRTFERFPYLPLLVAAVVISAWIGGLGPGLAAASGGAVAAEYLVMGGMRGVGTYPELLSQLAIFVALAAVVTSIRRSSIQTSAAKRKRLLWELQERVKELTLLHRATSLLQEETNRETLLRELVGLLPAAWQFPELLEARITVSNLVVSTPRFRPTPWLQQSEFPIHGAPPGVLEVVYVDAPPVETDGPFLPEEQTLLDSLATLLAAYFERAHRIEERLGAGTRAGVTNRGGGGQQGERRLPGDGVTRLRRPLTAMLGWTHMLREGSAVDSARALEVIERNATIQLRLIEELMDLSRAATGHLAVTFALVNLNAILRNVVDSAKPAASERDVEIIAMLADDDITVRGDGIRVQQIFGNLVGNAIKFTPAGGRVTITSERSPEHAQIIVADTGVGIEPELLGRVFETFWQADPATSSSREGLGLGLSIVRRLVELHGGTIEAHSAGNGAGTRMAVRLPLAPGADAAHCGNDRYRPGRPIAFVRGDEFQNSIWVAQSDRSIREQSLRQFRR